MKEQEEEAQECLPSVVLHILHVPRPRGLIRHDTETGYTVVVPIEMHRCEPVHKLNNN